MFSLSLSHAHEIMMYLSLFIVDLNGGIGIAEMVYNTNLMILVGGGESPKWPTNKCMLWDDAVQKIIGELSFNA